MGEKQIVGDDGHGTTTSGGGSLVDGGGKTTDGGPKVAVTPPPQDHPKTQERKDPCKDLTDKANELLKQLEALHQQNRDAMQRALRAFFGDPKSRTYGGYAHSLTSSKITEAVVDANNATGKTLIDVALFAAGGWGGIAGKGSTAANLLGEGIASSASAAEAWSKVALKVLSKAGDAMGGKAGTLGTTAAKTIDKWDDPNKWLQAPLGGVESLVRGAVIDALGNWMKKGAMNEDVARAQAAYAEFCGAAAVANTTASAAEQVHQQLKDVNAQLRAQGCPEVPIPDYVFYTFSLTQFGEGLFQGQTGPHMHSKAIESGVERDWDLFANTADPSGLPF